MMRTAKALLCVLQMSVIAGCATAPKTASEPEFGALPDAVPPSAPPTFLMHSAPQQPTFAGRIVPTDARPVRYALHPALPISGGTLLVTHDNAFAVAADPERDRVSIVELAGQRLRDSVPLTAGDEPGRLVEDDMGRVHVALRRAGAVASIDLEHGTLLDRRDVCSAPRGIAFDPSTRSLRVACAGGDLVTLPADSGAVTAREQLASDLRDVIVRPDGDVFVSRFKRAELLRLPGGSAPEMTATRPRSQPAQFPEPTGAIIVDALESEVAWRIVERGYGGMLMLHQGARTTELAISNAHDDPDTGAGSEVDVSIAASSPYGGGAPCSSVVQSELTLLSEQGEPTLSVRFGAVLAVDVAEIPGGVTPWSRRARAMQISLCPCWSRPRAVISRTGPLPARDLLCCSSSRACSASTAVPWTALAPPLS
jgi:hypothetical protein